MADDVIAIELKINASKSAKTMQEMVDTTADLNDELKKVEKGSDSFKKLTKQIESADDAMIDLAVNADKANLTIGELEETSALLNEELKGVERGSDEFVRLSNALRETNVELKNTELSLEALDSEQVASELGSVTGAVGDISGAFILLGGDGNESLEQIAGNIQTAMGLAMGFKGAIEGIQSGLKLYRNFNSIVKQSTVLMKAQAVAQGIWNFLTSKGNIIQKIQIATTAAASVGMAVLNAVMSLNPVFLLIAAFAALAGAMAFFSSSSDTAAASNEALNKSMEREHRLLENSIALTRKLGEQRLKVAELTGASEEELHKIRLENLSSGESARKKQIAAELKDIERKRKIYRKSLDEDNEDLAKSIKEDIQASRGKYRELIAQNGDFQRAVQVENLEFANAQQKARDEEIKAEEDQTKKEADELKKRHDDWKRLHDQRQKAEEKRVADLALFEEKIFQNSLFSSEDLQKRKLFLEFQANLERANRLIKDEDKLKKILLEIENEYSEDLQDMADKNTELEADKALKILNINRKVKAALDILEQEQALVNAENIDDEIEREKEKAKILIELDKAKINQLNVNQEIALQDTELTEDQRLEIIKGTELEISQIKQDQRDKDKEADEKALEDRKALNEELISSAFEVVQMIADSAFAIAAAARAKDFEDRREQLQFAFDFEQQQLQKKVDAGIKTQRVADRELEKLEKSKRNAEEKLAKEAFEKDKEVKRKQALINGALAITQIFASTPPPASFILAGVQVVATGLQVAEIEKQEFTRGGIITGPSHAGGGVDLGNGNEAEGDEIIINKNSSRIFRNQLSAINQAGGGVAFARGGIIPEGSQTDFNNGPLNDSIETLNRKLSRPFKAFVVGQEVEDKLNEEAQLNKNADL